MKKPWIKIKTAEQLRQELNALASQGVDLNLKVWGWDDGSICVEDNPHFEGFDPEFYKQ